MGGPHPGPLLTAAEKLTNTDDRIAEYKRLADEYPRCGPVLFNLAHDLHAAGRNDEATLAAFRAIALDPSALGKLRPTLRSLLDAPPLSATLKAPMPEPLDLMAVSTSATYGGLELRSSAGSQRLYDAVVAERQTAVTLREVLEISPAAQKRLVPQWLQSRYPAVAPLLDFAETPGPKPRGFQVLPRLRGDTLLDLVLAGRLERHGAIEIIHRVALLLDYLHSQDTFMGDLRPEHVFRDEGSLQKSVLLLGHPVTTSLPRRTLSSSLARLAWMSPEEAQGRELGAHTDVFSLGLLLYFAILRREPPPVDQRLDATLSVGDRKLDEILARCSATDPRRRYERVLDAAADLEALAPAKSLTPFSLTKVVGNWRLRHFIGEGGYATVYEAEHVSIPDRRAALKVVHTNLSADRTVRDMFKNEVIAATRIENPHVVRIFDANIEPDGTCFLAMEMLDGVTLRDLLARERIPWRRAVKIAQQVADALAAAHQSGIVHRDLKPENIILITRDGDPDFVKVIDFGIARVASRPSGHTGAHLLGTPAYMAPEQWLLEDVDGRTDVYALGIIVHEMVMGYQPFKAVSTSQFREAHLKAPIPMMEGMPVALKQVVERMLAKDREDRPAIADVVGHIAALSVPKDADRIADGRGKPLHWYRNPLMLGLGGLAVVMTVLIVLLIAISLRSHANQQPATPTMPLTAGHSPDDSSKAARPSVAMSPPGPRPYDGCTSAAPFEVGITVLARDRPVSVPSRAEILGWFRGIEPSSVSVYFIERMSGKRGIQLAVTSKWPKWKSVVGIQTGEDACLALGEALSSLKVGRHDGKDIMPCHDDVKQRCLEFDVLSAVHEGNRIDVPKGTMDDVDGPQMQLWLHPEITGKWQFVQPRTTTIFDFSTDGSLSAGSLGGSFSPLGNFTWIDDANIEVNIGGAAHWSVAFNGDTLTAIVTDTHGKNLQHWVFKRVL